MSVHSENTLLEISNLAVSFQTDGSKKTVVDEIHLSIRQQQCLAIVGESGSGKSITALSVLGLLPASASVKGSICFFNQHTSVELLKLTEKEINKIRGADISMIFQEPMTALNPLMTCGKQITEVLIKHQHLSKQQAHEKVLSLLKKTELPEPDLIFNKYPHQISGGQKQRVMIAMAIACEPKLLIADEPTTALDVAVQKSILKLLKKLQLEFGLSILFITHNLSILPEFADEIVVMRNGTVIEQGPANEILKHPKQPYTKALLECRPSRNSKGKKLPVVKDFLETTTIIDAIAEMKNAESNLKKQQGQSDPVLVVKELSFSYPPLKNWWGKIISQNKLIDNVSFEVFSGETLGIIGESGSGKSTIGKLLAGLLRPASGGILLNGQPIELVSRKKPAIQIVLQDPYSALNPKLSIGNAIEEPLEVWSGLLKKQDRKEKTVQLLKQVGLSADHYKKYPHEFSGGQRQRICIARALAMDPGFLIFDESVSALDVSMQAQILNLINELKSTYQFTSIFITHDLEVVRFISDRLLVMQAGKIIEQGNTEAVFNFPQEDYTKQLFGV